MFKNIKLILIRHGQSEGNVDSSVYCKVPDHEIELTDLGKLQAEEAGKSLASRLNGDWATIVYSPFKRAKDTALILQQHISGVSVVEDPLINEMYIVHSFEEMKTVENYEVQERKDFGEFWYKKGTSESYADAYTRARIFYQDLYLGKYSSSLEDTVIVVAHGIFLAMLKGVINRSSTDQIVKQQWLKNCEFEEFNLKVLDA